MFVVTGNRLLDGIVVYLASAQMWVEDLQSALCFDSEDEAQSVANEQSDVIVSLDVIPVVRDEAGQIQPARLREKIRALGPTINPFETIDLERRFDAAAN